MPVDITMPKLSDTMEEGKILRWAKREGDPVAIGETIAEVETDKANMELEAYDEGTLVEVRVREGESAPVGAVIAVLTAPGETAAPRAEKKEAAASREEKQPAAEQKPAPKQKPVPEQRPAAEETAEEKPAEQKPAASPRKEASAPASEERPAEQGREAWRPTVVRRGERAEEPDTIKASPLARRIAREQGVDLRGIRGTGPGGRIVEKDVEAAAAAPRGPTADRPPAQAAAAPTAPPAERRASAPARRLELSRLRRVTAKRMAEAKREIPHFYASAEIAMDDAARLKDGLAGLGGDYEGITFTHLVLKAAGLALVRVPEVNAAYDVDGLVLHDDVNIGMATAVDEGLIVPVVHRCDREPLAVIVKQARGLVERARAGRFAGDDLSGGTFTVSNLGMFPVSDFAAVINPPQAAILAVGTIREVPVVRGGQVVPGRVMTVTLSCDHRVIDGVLAGRFLRELKALLEQPFVLLA